VGQHGKDCNVGKELGFAKAFIKGGKKVKLGPGGRQSGGEKGGSRRGEGKRRKKAMSEARSFHGEGPGRVRKGQMLPVR